MPKERWDAKKVDVIEAILLVKRIVATVRHHAAAVDALATNMRAAPEASQY
jgi:hypothetical protein